MREAWPFLHRGQPRHGAYRLGLTRVDLTTLLAPDPASAARLRHRQAQLKTRRHQCFAAPASLDAPFLALRRALPTPLHRADDLRALSTWLCDDLCFLDEDQRLRGGVLTAPSGWRLDDRLGQSLARLHEPVPGLWPTLGNAMTRVLDRLEPGQAFMRRNWFFYDAMDWWRAEGPALRPAFLRLPPEDQAQRLVLRWERQGLFRPRGSRWTMFFIRVHHRPLRDLAGTAAAAAFKAVLERLSADEQASRRVPLVAPALRTLLAPGTEA